jgi:predicted DNA-binding transcriptional regulator YafY
MRRADRLFHIIQILRRARAPVTADALAAELETSKRTVYRDVVTLVGQRVPIRGEAGVGYVLEGGFDLPPLMLTPDEIEAAVLGAQWVMGRGDPSLARAAQDLIAKIAATVPEHLRPYVLEPATGTPPAFERTTDALDLARVRAQIRAGRKLRLRYRDERGRESERTVWPVAVGYLEAVRHLIAYCELRQDFRHFRTDRVIEATFLDTPYPERPAALRAKWRRALPERMARRPDQGEAGAAPRRKKKITTPVTET